LLLEKEHKVRTWVISVISEGLFREQEESYQNQILPGDVPVFGLTAGLPSTLSGLLGKQGRCHGLEHFGYSAPAGVLDQKFGFTPEHVVTLVLEQLKK
jgi:transketolase